MSRVVEELPGIGVVRVSRWIFNCYVVRGPEGVVVVDAGLPSAATDLADVIPGETVVAVLATHCHSDHVGGAQGLGAPVHLPARARAYVEGERPRTPTLRDIARIAPTMVSQPFDLAGLRASGEGAKVAGYGGRAGMLWSGDAAYLGDVPPGLPDWQVLPLPGHTDDSVGFWHADSGTLLSGDAVLSRGGRAWPTPEVVDPAAAAESRKALRTLEIRHLLPGHGKPVHDAAASIS